MEKIILIFSISSAGFVLSETFIKVFQHFKRFPPKPLSCGYCLSFWMGLIYFFNLGFEGFFNACLCAVVSSLLFKWTS